MWQICGDDIRTAPDYRSVVLARALMLPLGLAAVRYTCPHFSSTSGSHQLSLRVECGVNILYHVLCFFIAAALLPHNLSTAAHWLHMISGH